VLQVAVTHGGTPVPGAMVCASMASDTLVYAYSLTDTVGIVELNIAPSDTGRLRLVVTGQNLYPYDTTIPIHYTNVAEPAASLPTRAVTLTATPSCFSGTTTISYSAPAPEPSCPTFFLKVYDAFGRCVAGWSLGIGNPSFLLDLRSKPTSTYLCILQDIKGQSLAMARLVKIR